MTHAVLMDKNSIKPALCILQCWGFRSSPISFSLKEFSLYMLPGGQITGCWRKTNDLSSNYQVMHSIEYRKKLSVLIFIYQAHIRNWKQGCPLSQVFFPLKIPELVHYLLKCNLCKYANKPYTWRYRSIVFSKWYNVRVS